MLVTIIFATQFRRVVRVVEGARLESVYTRKGIEGSNPSLSAKNRSKEVKSPQTARKTKVSTQSFASLYRAYCYWGSNV